MRTALAAGARLLCTLAFAAAATSFAGSLQPWKGDAQGQDVAVDPDGLVHVAFGGESSHLGRYTAQGAHRVNSSDLTFAGAATLVAANGDHVDITYEGQVEIEVDVVLTSGLITIHGGTGRFRNAVGSASFTGSAWDGAFEFDFDGALGTPAAALDKRK